MNSIRAYGIYALVTGLVFFIAATFIKGGPPTPQTSSLPPAESYFTYVSTDKPIYRGGEKVYVRGVLLSVGAHAPSGESGRANFEILGPKGESVFSGIANFADSVAGFAWDIPAGQAGGEYTVRITGAAPAERKFDIRAYRAPRLKSQIVFVRDGYGPGDTVAANLHVDRAEGGIPAGATVSVVARVDGEEVWKGETRVDVLGNASTSFKLPIAIARGEGTLAMVIQDGGTVETASKTIPILLQTLDLAIYPEGGDLIAGLMNRVYIEGRTPAKKPADIAGVLMNSAGKQVATFRAEHEGRARFSFVPINREMYSLRITEPAGITTVFPLPSVKASGVTLTSTSEITPKLKDVVVRVASTADGTYGVALTQHGREFSFKSVALRAGEPSEIAFAVPPNLDGVIVATVFDDQRIPIAERLLFRQPEHSLKVQVTADRTDYVPGDKVRLRVATTDDKGKPVGGVVGLTVTDSSVLEMIDKREQTGRLPVMVLLESEVQNLADAHVYLDETNPKAPLATDLLLGTQGWRRFATVDTAKFVRTYGDAARRILAGQAVPNAQWVSLGADGVVMGSVTDSSAALIPGVTVSATSIDTAAVTTTVPNISGTYSFSRLPPGRYRLSASAPGFQTQTLKGVQLNPGTSYRFNIQMDVANNFADLQVAAMPLLLKEAALKKDRIENLPVNGRDLPEVLPGLRADEAEDKQLKREGALGKLVVDGIALEDRRFNQERAQFVPVVREYAHTRRPNWNEGSRADFSETVYWNAGIKTDATTGIATVSFDLSDSITAFRVLADGFAQDGALGSGVSEIESVRPFFIEPKVPLQITSGDVIQLPIGVINGLSRELRGTEITGKVPAGMKLNLLGSDSAMLRARERSRRLMQIEVGRQFSGSADLSIDASAGPYRDSVSRKIDVQPLGFPYEASSGGVLEPNGSKTFTFTLPTGMVSGSLSSSIMVYPTPLSNMTQALQSLLQQPNGCFEQTSSTSYPMVMAQQYFLTHSGVDPAVIEKTKGLLETSYKRLTGFESHSRGYEWFGADPGHEALTAYGLMQFTDMAQVRSVDKDMLERTRAWLLSRRDGKGGFNLSPKAIDSFGGAPVDTTNAYITWALIESGEKGLEGEIAAVKRSADSTEDSYIIALAANILHATGDSAGARTLLDKLAKMQDPNGAVKGGVTTITRSGGDALAIETTALSTLAWMRDSNYAANVEKSLRWIVESNKNGRFASTQSTILALRAIVAYDAAHARPKAPGRVLLVVDGKSVGKPFAFTPDTQGAITLPDAGELSAGKHTFVLKMEEGSSMPYSMTVKYNSALPDSSEKAQIGIRVALRDQHIAEGGVTEAVVSITNKSDQVIPTPVAIVGIPGGLEVRHDQLKELVKSGKIDAYEVIGREVVLYWRFLKAHDTFDLPLSVVAAIPGTYTGPASRAYLYYTDEYKDWAPGLSVSIAAR